jgi:hypothetical protein
MSGVAASLPYTDAELDHVRVMLRSGPPPHFSDGVVVRLLATIDSLTSDGWLRDMDHRVEKYADAERAAVARKDWAMADRWRHMASGVTEAIEAFRAVMA